MNTHLKHILTWGRLERMPLLFAALLLLRATWLPVIEIKGFDTFALDSIAMWATRAARFTLIASILTLLIRSRAPSRWWMALSVGILFGPLSDMAVRAADLAKMMQPEGIDEINHFIIILPGTWICMAGLIFWLGDLVTAVSCYWNRKKSGM